MEEVPVKGRVGVTSQEAPGAEARTLQRLPEGLSSGVKGECQAGSDSVLPRPHNSMSAWSGKTQESSLAAATGMGNDMVSFQIP